ncbi:MAG TPA: alpha/beta hydrolase [Armatimonadota bacterium]|nr:alpha/beta hydrolase [Armatimonadota bacterium]
MHVQEWGTKGPWVIALHGGPAAPGSAAPIARALSAQFRVLEPWQRGSGDEPLTVARHVDDLHELVASLGGVRPALVGESWGAMLALAYAAAHPGSAACLALVGCGTFDTRARARLHAILEERASSELRTRLERLAEECPDPGEQLRHRYELTRPLYSYDPVDDDYPYECPGPLDMRAHTETWEDMVRQQDAGVYPAAFALIRCPVAMFHGDYDPHPGRMICAGLRRLMPQIEYVEFEWCGHSPWEERHAREPFFAALSEWLERWASG